MKPLVPANIESLKPYPPGKPMDEVKRELGVDRVIKLASNENPFGPPPKAIEAIRDQLDQIHRYPDGSAYYLKQALTELTGHGPERLVIGCGTNEILDLICRVFVGSGGKAVLPHPTFLVYSKFLQAIGAEVVTIPLRGMAIDLAAMADAVDEETNLVVICNPNNPTGAALAKDEIEAFVKSMPPRTVVLIDEAYIEYVRDEKIGSGLDLIDDDSMVVVSRTFSKVYGLAGLRVGYGVMSTRLADYLNRVRQPFNVTVPALAAAEGALGDKEYIDSVLDQTWRGLDLITKSLTDMGLEVEPSQTNFILFKSPVPAKEVYERMLRRGVIIRHMGSFGLEDYLRVSVGTAQENELFITEIAAVLGEMGHV